MLLVVGQRSGAALASPEASLRRAVFPSTLLVIPNVICMCHLAKIRSEAVAPTAPCRVASARCALGATASDRFFGRWHIHITFGITGRVLGEPPLRWSASGLAGAAPRHCALRGARIVPESAADVASGGATLRRRAGISRSCPSQGSLSMYSTRDTKRNMYVSSPKNSIRGRSTEGTPCGGDPTHGALGATDLDRILGDGTYILRLVSGVEYL